MSDQTAALHRDGAGWVDTIRAIYQQEKNREATSQEIADHLAWILEARDGGWDANKMRAYVRSGGTPGPPPGSHIRTVAVIVQDGQPIEGVAVALDDIGGRHTGVTNRDGYIAFDRVTMPLPDSNVWLTKDGYNDYSHHVSLPDGNYDVVIGRGNLPPFTGSHRDPAAWTDDRLLAVRGALNIKLNVPFGPRPNQNDNIASTNGMWNHSPADQDRILAAYKARGYTHGPIGPFVDPGYHGQIAGIDFRDDADRLRAEAAIEKIWDADICPVVFIQNDGWSIDAMRQLEPIFRSARWQRLCRVVCNGFEQQGSKYGWSNQDYIDWLSWLRSVFPNAKRFLHTIADIEAPVGRGDDTSHPGMSNGECWARVTPLVHGWLHQSESLFHPEHVDPVGDGRTDAQHWLELFNRTKGPSFLGRFQRGHAGWPTTSANGGPMKIYAGEYWSYIMYWQNASEDTGRDYGGHAFTLGADGYFDGGRG